MVVVMRQRLYAVCAYGMVERCAKRERDHCEAICILKWKMPIKKRSRASNRCIRFLQSVRACALVFLCPSLSLVRSLAFRSNYSVWFKLRAFSVFYFQFVVFLLPASFILAQRLSYVRCFLSLSFYASIPLFLLLLLLRRRRRRFFLLIMCTSPLPDLQCDITFGKL